LQERTETCGEAVRKMKWRAMYNDDEFRNLIDSLAEIHMPVSEMEDVILSHMYTYNLLGDPAVRMMFPHPIKDIDLSPDPAFRGSEISFSGTVGEFQEGTVYATLEVERIVIPWKLEPVSNPNDPASYKTIQANHTKAVNKVIASKEVQLSDGSFSDKIQVPPDAPTGIYYLKIFVDNGAIDAIGHRQLLVQ